MARLNFVLRLTAGEESNLSYASRPSWFRNWEVTGLLKFDDKNQDGLIQYDGYETNEMIKVDRDIMVLANPEIAGLPNWVIALVAAGGLAAALSTAAGLLLAISSAISHDLLKGVFRPDISERKSLRQVVLLWLLLLLLRVILVLIHQTLLQERSFSIWPSCLIYFPCVDDGIFSKSINKEGAIAGMLAGIGITLYMFSSIRYYVYPVYIFFGEYGTQLVFGIEPNAFGAIGAMVNFIVVILCQKRMILLQKKSKK